MREEKNGKWVWGRKEIEKKDDKVQFCAKCGECVQDCKQYCVRDCGRQSGRRECQTKIELVDKILTEEVTETVIENGDKIVIKSWYQDGRCGMYNFFINIINIISVSHFSQEREKWKNCP